MLAFGIDLLSLGKSLRVFVFDYRLTKLWLLGGYRYRDSVEK